MKQFFLLSLFNAVLLNSRSDLTSYREPFTNKQSSPFQGNYNTSFSSSRRMLLKQIISETNDGFIFRKTREDIGLTFKDIEYKKKPRLDQVSPFGTITFELDSTVQII